MTRRAPWEGEGVMKYTRFRDIPQLTSWGGYSVDIGFGYMEEWLKSNAEWNGLDLDPDFQRGHVWREEQQRAFVEFILRGGRSSRDILWNCVNWQNRSSDPMGAVTIVDGKQRLEACRKFMRDELRVFGSYRSEFTDNIRLVADGLRFHVNNLTTRVEVLQWYIDLNAGGVVHTEEEIRRVRELLDSEKARQQ